MSSAGAEIFALDGQLIGRGVYHGTSDTQEPQVRQDDATAWAHHDGKGEWNAWNRARDCRHDGEPCIVYSHYGGGFYWPSKVCRECEVLIGRLGPWADPDYYRTDEAFEAEKQYGKEGWPKDGHPFLKGNP